MKVKINNMDLSIPGSTNSPLSTSLIPVFGDNVQDLLGTGALQVNPSAIITVNSLADGVDDLNSGVTTLRDAINQANGDNGSDLIVFDRSLFSNQQTITLSGTELDITHNLDIIAPRDPLTGADLVTVSGNKTSRVFEIEAGATVSIDGLIVTDGPVKGNVGGGKIMNSGILTLDNSIVSEVSASSDTVLLGYSISSGGGIYNSGNLSVNNSTISNNEATIGGGIYNSNSGNFSVNNSTISGNLGGGKGGGIYNSGNLSVNSSTISGRFGMNFPIISGSGIYNDYSGTSTVNDSTISGNLGVSGGGIFNSGGTVVVNNTTISGNSGGISYGIGGGIYNTGNFSISNSTINNNSAAAGYSNPIYGGTGGGIYNDNNGILTVSNCIISDNSTGSYNGRVGAIDNLGMATINNSTISGNGSYVDGGIDNSGTLTVSNSTISGNTSVKAGGAIYSDGTLTVINSTISGNNGGENVGGGISNGGILTVINSTISDNTRGSGISNYSTATVYNSTISGNSTLNSSGNLGGGKGSGIYNDYSGTLTLLFSTITQNQAVNDGGGVYQKDVPPSSSAVRGSIRVRNTIIAANLNSTGGINPDVSGTFTSEGYNLIGDSTGSTGFDATGDIVGTSDNPIDPRLAPLDFYGGSTKTIALLPDSPAIDAGDPTVLDTDPTTDQRGFPRVVNGRADIGAFEFSS